MCKLCLHTWRRRSNTTRPAMSARHVSWLLVLLMRDWLFTQFALYCVTFLMDTGLACIPCAAAPAACRLGPGTTCRTLHPGVRQPGGGSWCEW